MKCKSLALLVGASVISISTSAAEVNWSGFLSAVAGQTMDEGTTRSVGFLGYDAIYDDELRFEPLSKVGLQGQVIVNDKLRATVQFVGRGSNSFDVEAEWAYLSYDLSETVTFNAGRYRVPLYYYSDFLDVGYSYHWIRPPIGVYAGPSYHDGVNFVYSNYFGDYQLTAQAFYGNWEGETPVPGVRQEFEKSYGANILFGSDIWKLRYVVSSVEGEVYVANQVPSPNPSLGPGLGTVEIPLGPSVADYQALSAIIDLGGFFLRSEYIDLDIDDRPTNSWYVSAGYSFGDITPHITQAYTEEPVGPDPDESSDTTIVGVAWNFNSNAVFKIEFEQTDYENELFFSDVDVLTFGIDVVF